VRENATVIVRNHSIALNARKSGKQVGNTAIGFEAGIARLCKVALWL
jgi:hypothetical protein